MSRNKYHVTIEDEIDEDDIYQQISQRSGEFDLDINSINQDSQRQAWDQVNALEEQARSEKIQDQSVAMVNASQTARIIKEAQQSSGY